MRILRLFLLGSFLALTACKSSQAPQGPAPDPNDYLTFLQVNDVYEIAPIQGGKYGGMARLATLKKQLRKEKPPLFTVMAGDFLSPSVIGTVKLDGQRVQGAHMIAVMNAVGFDLACFGNHEFDLKEAELQARLDESEFEWIAGNVRQNGPEGPQAFQQQELPVEATKMLQVPRAQGSPLRIGVMSLCLPANQPDYVHYEDLKESALAQWRDLLPRSDFIVALTHLSIDQDRELASWLPGLKLIMGGHEHDHHYEVVGGVPIAKADANAKTAYVHRVSFNRYTGDVSVKSELNAIDETLSPDPEIAARVQDWEEKAYAAFKAQGLDLDAPVASLETPLDGLEAHIRNRQTNLGQAMTQAMYQAWDSVDCAL
ncbi:MAG: metallophosphoesterase, partial [Bacteroidota bacterium]